MVRRSQAEVAVKARILGLIWILLGSLVGGCTGFVSSGLAHVLSSGKDYEFLSERVNLPHHVPQYSGGVSLRFSMVHDVLHERFPKHGAPWYEERNRQTEERLTGLNESDRARWPLIDDLAVAYERLGRPADAIPLLRDKLQSQEAAGVSRRELYTTLANLGTMLIHANAAKARLADAEAVERFDEGIQLVRRSVEVNPEAHFGREKWQESIAEFLRATFQDPSLLKKFDCLGNRLDLPDAEVLTPGFDMAQAGYSRPAILDFFHRWYNTSPFKEFSQPGIRPDDPALWAVLSPIRLYITKIGAEEGWDLVDVPSHQSPVPFDEPVLGIIGMWRQGGGANPHFALALGETMLRVGQRYIAWTAFERASLLAERYSPDAELKEFLRNHCAQRQAAIEVRLAPEPTADKDQLRPAFVQEFAHGQKYQQDYQAFEEERIAAGQSIDDDHFFDDFMRDHSSIASPVGLEETAVIARSSAISEYGDRDMKSSSLLGAGIGAMLVAIIGYVRRRWKLRGTVDQARPN